MNIRQEYVNKLLAKPPDWPIYKWDYPERRLEMSTGDVPCSCCGGYHGCNCGKPQTFYGGGFEDKRIVELLEQIVELLEGQESIVARYNRKQKAERIGDD